jgi:Flp pilus assembly protein TadB
MRWLFILHKIGGKEMEDQNNNKLGLASILTIIFVVAKLFGLIAWSWWVVFSPILVVVVFWILVVIIAMLISKNIED